MAGADAIAGSYIFIDSPWEVGMIGGTDDWGAGVDELPPGVDEDRPRVEELTPGVEELSPGVEELFWDFASILAFPVYMTLIVSVIYHWDYWWYYL